MISYCPIDQDQDYRPPALAKPLQSLQKTFLEGEDTECNYLVMFFILGVLVLAITDTLKKN